VTSANPTSAPRHYRSKTLAAWLALLLGSLGVHRMYMHGLRDVRAWLHPLPTALGLLGVDRMQTLGQDDRLAWLLVPVLGLMLSLAMLQAIVWALTPDDVWQQRYNPGRAPQPTGWGPVLAAGLALLLGGTVLTGTIAFGGQKFFEWQLGTDAAEPVQNSSRLRP
jgi:hypothetical protein